MARRITASVSPIPKSTRMSLESAFRSPHAFPTVGALAITFAVVIGFADMPYGYYMLLRFALCGFCIYCMFGAGFVLAHWERWALGAAAVLYNPLLPVRLGEKSIWSALNMATLVLLWVIVARRVHRQPRHG